MKEDGNCPPGRCEKKENHPVDERNAGRRKRLITSAMGEKEAPEDPTEGGRGQTRLEGK